MVASWICLARNLLVGAALVLSTGAARSQVPDSEINRALMNPNFKWRSFAAAGVRVYYQPGSFAERQESSWSATVTGARSTRTRSPIS
jgi:hypothetical protein